MVNVPYDVWFRIAEFLPSEVLRTLYSVNRAFFELALNERYRKLELYFTDREAARILGHLRDPALASRVRYVRIHPSNIEAILARRNSTSRNPRALVRRFLNHIAPGKPAVMNPLQSTDQPSAVFDVISNLSQVKEYVIVWLPSRNPRQEVHVSPRLLAAVRSIFTPTLKRLTLHLSVGVMRNILEKPSQFQSMHNLESFDVKVYASSFHIVETNSDPLFDYLCPLIRIFSNTLRHLSISLQYHDNHSLLFERLGQFPQLNRLDLNTALDEIHHPDLLSFKNFLNNHATTLRHFSLKPFHCGFGGVSCLNTTTQQLRRITGRRCLSGVKLHLRSLELNLRLLSDDMTISGGLSSLHGFTDSLVSLSLVDRWLTDADIQVLANSTLGSNLTTLAFTLSQLNPGVIDTLALKLPQLLRLDISFRNVIPHIGVEPILIFYAGGWVQDQRQVDMFYAEMRRRSYPAWALEHLGISCYTMPESFTIRHREVIAACIPALGRATSVARFI